MRTKGPKVYKGKIAAAKSVNGFWLKFLFAILIVAVLLVGLLGQNMLEQVLPEPTVAEQSSDAFNTHCMGAEPPEPYQLSGLLVTLGNSNFPVITVSTAAPAESGASPNQSDNPTTNPPVLTADAPPGVSPNATPARKDQPDTTTSAAIKNLATALNEQKTPVQPVALRPANNTSNTWIMQQSAGHYTLQIVSGRNRSALLEMAQRHVGEQPYAIFTRKLEGRPWHSLIVGSYPSYGAASRAIKKLPRALKANQAWPKKFAEIHQQIERQ